MSRKYLNFDLDTKALQECYPDRDWHEAYMDIRKFLENNGFEHRQGSGYISKQDITYAQLFVLVQRMSKEYLWMQSCVRNIDATNVGKTLSLKEIIKDAHDERMQEILASQRRGMKRT